MTQPTVSVIIPTYNRADLLCQAIDSVLQQTYQNYEVIVADDGSTDDTRDRVKQRYGERVRLISIAHTGMPAPARNAGIVASKGDFVAFLDSDDLWLPHRLERQMASAAKDQTSGLFFAFSEKFDDSGVHGTTVSRSRPQSGNVFELLLLHNFIAIDTVLIRRDVLATVGLFDTREEYRAVEDYELWLRIAHQYPVRFIPETLARYRVHGNNLSQGSMLRLARMESVVKNICDSFKVRPSLARRVLARFDLDRSKILLRSPHTQAEAKTYLRRAIRVDPTSLSARALYGFTTLGGAPLLRFYLRHILKRPLIQA